MGRLSTHVLDTMAGGPAAGVAVALARIGAGGARDPVVTLLTNADGRTDAPLLSGDSFIAGRYEITFHIGAYFRARGVAGGFLDEVPVRFDISDQSAHYHVPLLVSPFSYTTYRGS